MVGDSDDESNLPLKLNVTQVSRICQAYANCSSANIKFLKSQLSKIVPLGSSLLSALEIYAVKKREFS